MTSANFYPRKRHYYQAYDLQYYRNMKQALFDILGSVCVRCGFADPRALQIDHIDGGGNAEHREYGSPRNMYQFYRRNADLARQRLQVLCANCNWIKKSENREHAGKKARSPHMSGVKGLKESDGTAVIASYQPNVTDAAHLLAQFVPKRLSTWLNLASKYGYFIS